jgi:predicted SnoaL-like aldol condensation-catalyzing enzyme
MRSRHISVVLGACLLAGCATPGAVLRASLAKQNTAVVLAFLDTAFNRHEVEQAFKLYVGPYYRQHNPNLADGVAAAVSGLTHLTHELYPGYRLEVKRAVAQGDLVVVHSRGIRTEAERDNGLGQAFADIFRLEHGKIVEHWEVAQEVPATSANDNTLF